jgi:predicted SPOUT superfamily RNA methylase MTH1
MGVFQAEPASDTPRNLRARVKNAFENKTCSLCFLRLRLLRFVVFYKQQVEHLRDGLHPHINHPNKLSMEQHK